MRLFHWIVMLGGISVLAGACKKSKETPVTGGSAAVVSTGSGSTDSGSTGSGSSVSAPMGSASHALEGTVKVGEQAGRYSVARDGGTTRVTIAIGERRATAELTDHMVTVKVGSREFSVGCASVRCARALVGPDGKPTAPPAHTSNASLYPWNRYPVAFVQASLDELAAGDPSFKDDANFLALADELASDAMEAPKGKANLLDTEKFAGTAERDGEGSAAPHDAGVPDAPGAATAPDATALKCKTKDNKRFAAKVLEGSLSFPGFPVSASLQAAHLDGSSDCWREPAACVGAPTAGAGLNSISDGTPADKGCKDGYKAETFSLEGKAKAVQGKLCEPGLEDNFAGVTLDINYGAQTLAHFAANAGVGNLTTSGKAVVSISGTTCYQKNTVSSDDAYVVKDGKKNCACYEPACDVCDD